MAGVDPWRLWPLVTFDYHRFLSVYTCMCFVLIEVKVLTVTFTILCDSRKLSYYFHSTVVQTNV